MALTIQTFFAPRCVDHLRMSASLSAPPGTLHSAAPDARMTIQTPELEVPLQQDTPAQMNGQAFYTAEMPAGNKGQRAKRLFKST